MSYYIFLGLPLATNLEVSDIGTTSLTVSWDMADMTGVDGFQVSWCVPSYCARTYDTTTDASIELKNLQDFTNYTIFVCAYQKQQYSNFVGSCANTTTKTLPAGEEPIVNCHRPASNSSTVERNTMPEWCHQRFTTKRGSFRA